MAHRCAAGSLTAISAALAVELSTICASSRHTRHQRNRVSGVGMTFKQGQGLSASVAAWHGHQLLATS